METKIGWYIRVSTDDQKESLEMYRNQANDFCQRYGFNLVKIYSDEDVSGGIELFKRPQGKVLKQDLDNGTINAIASPDVTRLFRDLRDGVNTIYDMQDEGIEIFTGDGYGTPLDVNTPQGFSMVMYKLQSAHYERLIIKERTKKAMTFRRNNSLATSREQYGYNIVIEGKQKKRIENEKEQLVVKLILGMKKANQPLATIADTLNRNNIPTKTQQGKWHPSTIKSIISFQEKLQKN